MCILINIFQESLSYHSLTPSQMVDHSKELEEDKRRYKKLMERVHWFFCTVFVFGFARVPDADRFFHLPPSANLTLYVEVRYL